MRSYTSQQIVPLLQAHQARIKAFLPQTVPAFSATEVFSLTGEKAYQRFYENTAIAAQSHRVVGCPHKAVLPV